MVAAVALRSERISLGEEEKGEGVKAVHHEHVSMRA